MKKLKPLRASVVLQANDIISIIHVTEKNQRSPDQLDKMAKCIENFTFFKQLKEKNDKYQGGNILHKLCRVMQMENFIEGQTIYVQDQKPDKFYFVFEGEVGVVQQLKESDQKVESQISSPRRNKKLKDENLKQEDQICEGILEQSRRVTHFHSDNQFCKMEYNELSGKLEKGDVFGELDILNNSGRQNTIICLKNCILLVLEREEYMDSLMKLQKDKIEKKIIFFQSVIRLPQEIIHKNYYYFSKIKFARNNYVIKQAQPYTYAYIIKSGELIIQTKLNQSLLALNQLTSSNIFAIEPLFQTIHYHTYSVIVTSSTATLYAIEIKTLKSMFKEYPFILQEYSNIFHTQKNLQSDLIQKQITIQSKSKMNLEIQVVEQSQYIRSTANEMNTFLNQFAKSPNSKPELKQVRQNKYIKFKREFQHRKCETYTEQETNIFGMFNSLKQINSLQQPQCCSIKLEEVKMRNILQSYNQSLTSRKSMHSNSSRCGLLSIQQMQSQMRSSIKNEPYLKRVEREQNEFQFLKEIKEQEIRKLRQCYFKFH